MTIHKYRTSSPAAASRSGLTLVEALVGTAILGTLLATLLIAEGRMNKQAGCADRAVEACAWLDEAVDQWYRRPQEFPRNTDGRTGGEHDWIWRSRTRRETWADDLGLEIVRVEVFAGRDFNRPPLAEVELLLPKEEAQSDEQ